MAINIYLVKTAPCGIPIIPIPDPQLFWRENLQKFSGITMAGHWRLQEFNSGEPSRPPSDFYNLTPRALAFSSSVVLLEEVGRILDYSGELLPARIADFGLDIYLLNVTAKYNCLDVSKSIFRTKNGREVAGRDDGVGLVKPAFFPKLIGDSSLFKLASHPSFVYAVSGCHDEADDFFIQYNAANLKGLDFERIWSDNDLARSE